MSSQFDSLALLEAAGAGGLPHAKASLLEHLLGTHGLLAQWGNSSQVCKAGLFHSVYGTEHYHFQCMDLGQREKVKEAIGAESEFLAFEFGQSSLYELLQSNPTCLGDDTANRASLTCQLLEIHAANLAEQWDGIPSDLKAKIRARDSQLWFSKKSMLSHGAFAALAKVMAWEGN